MHNLINTIIEHYTGEKYSREFEEALLEYIEKAGKAINDSPEYESYMQRFQAWYVFQWVNPQGEYYIEDYIKNHELSLEEEAGLLSLNFSIFETLEKTKDHWIIKDILHQKKYYLSDLSLVLMKDDLFIGRVAQLNEDHLVEGVCLVPKNLLSLIKKQCRQVRSMISLKKEEDYLLKLESLCLRANMYRNLSHESLFDIALT